jgi:hypothetical protein
VSLIDVVAEWSARRRAARAAAHAPRVPVWDLNALAGIPSSHAAPALGDEPAAELCLLDHSYLDRERTLAGMALLMDLCRSGRADFSTKTLLLAAGGLHPIGDDLFGLLGAFRTHHVFFGCWNGLHEIVQLDEARLRSLYYMPVASRLQRVRRRRVPRRPHPRVFVSLGGDDDLDLVRAVVAATPELRFFVPTVAWEKPGSEKRYAEVAIAGANVTPVDCSVVRRDGQPVFSPAYTAAYDACDVVLLATRRDKMFQMRGGVRVADALYGRKLLVMAENPMCQLLMAQHERTCLVFEHDAAQASEQLRRVARGGFAVDPSAYEEIRGLTDSGAQLRWMIAAALHPETARASALARPAPLALARRALLARGREFLEREVAARAAMHAAQAAPAAPAPRAD